MPSYIIFKAVDGFNPDDPITYLAGYPVDVFDHDALHGRIIPPKYVQVCITDEDDHESIKQEYNREWRKQIDWEFTAHNYVLDGHRLRVWMKPEVVSVSNLNKLSREGVESWLNKWNASVIYATPNPPSVTFDAGVYDAITSEGFWDRDVRLVGFTEVSYTQESGVHVVEANYGGSPIAGMNNPEHFLRTLIEDRNGTVETFDTNKVIFSISRDIVFDQFKMAIKRDVEMVPFSRRQFKLLPAHIQMCIDAGGTLNVTHQQFATYIRNRLDD